MTGLSSCTPLCEGKSLDEAGHRATLGLSGNVVIVAEALSVMPVEQQ